MWELLLVPLLGLGLLAVPLGLGEDEGGDTGSDMPETDAPTEPEIEIPEVDEFEGIVSRETDGVLFSGAEAGVTENTDGSAFDVAGTDGDDIIEVADSPLQFTVTPGAGADQITIGLNSNVDMGEPVFGTPDIAFPGEGDSVPERVLTSVDTADTDEDEIFLQVTEEGIGSAPGTTGFTSRIDLSDPDDALFIDIPSEIEGNLHLIEVTAGDGGGAFSFDRFFTLAILTDTDVSELTDMQARDIAFGDETDIAVTTLAFIEQGSLTEQRASADPEEERDDLQVRDDVNEDPMIASNRAVSSISSVVL